MKMRRSVLYAVCGFFWLLMVPAAAQRGESPSSGPPADDPIKALAGRLELERYKATVKGLTQFGDRRQGTDRNRAAVDWIEAQLKSYGCSNVARLKYEYQPRPPMPLTEGIRLRDTIRAVGGEIGRAHV